MADAEHEAALTATTEGMGWPEAEDVIRGIVAAYFAAREWPEPADLTFQVQEAYWDAVDEWVPIGFDGGYEVEATRLVSPWREVSNE